MEHAAPPDTRRRWRVRLSLSWWLQPGLYLLPALLLGVSRGSFGTPPVQLGLPLFGLGLLSLFVSLSLFRTYKHALIATGNALGSAAEPDAWTRLAAWIGALGLWFGLEGIAVLLLCAASLILWLLYRLPRQLA